MVTWGLVSGCTALGRGAVFVLPRSASCSASPRPGFFPGIILYLTWWFPSAYRSRIVATFMAAIPISVTFSARWWPGVLLQPARARRPHRVVEAVHPRGGAGRGARNRTPFLAMTDRPEHADWLEPAQRDLADRAARGRTRPARGRSRHYSLGGWPCAHRRYAAAEPGLFRRHLRQLRPRMLVPAADRPQARRGLRHDRPHKRDPLCVRRLRDDPVGPSFGPHRRARRPHRYRLFARRRRSHRLRAEDRSDHDDGDAGARLDGSNPRPARASGRC